MKKNKRSKLELQDAAAKGLPLRKEEIAELLYCSESTISRYTEQGMPCMYIGAVKMYARGSRPRYIYNKCIEWLGKKQGR